MSRKTAAQKARAAAAAPASKPTTTETKRKHQGQDDRATAKKPRFDHHGTSKPMETSKDTDSHAVDWIAIASEPSNGLPGHPRPPAPAPPPSMPSNTLILPPEADDAKLRSQCDLHTIGLTANSKMESKIKQTLQVLQSSPSDGNTMLVALTASLKAANKCVSVAEIAKRELAKAGIGKVYQYTGCWTRLETYVPKPRREEPKLESKSKDEGEGEVNSDEQGKKFDEGEDDEDDAFETPAITERKQVRNTMCLVIYLALAPVPRLREKYGEQVHEGDKG